MTAHRHGTPTGGLGGGDLVEGKVSVVLPTAGRGSVVGDAIESVLEQSHESLELLVVDGGPADRTRSVVDSISDPRLRYHRHAEDAGPSTARNAGVRESDGEFVAFIDSDDRWRADKLERQVAAVREAGPDCAVAYTGVEKDFDEPRTRSGASGDVEAAVRRMEVPTYTSTLLVRRRAFEDCGGFDESLPCFEDWELCLRLASEHEFRFLDGSLVEKGTTGDNLSAEPDRLSESVKRLRQQYDLPTETLAHLYADVGITYCETGQFREGRTNLRRALRRQPGRPKAVAALVLSLSGSQTTFDSAMSRVYEFERGFAT